MMQKIAALAIIAVSAVFGIHAFAQVRADVRTSVMTPIASSSSNGISFAWFYDPTDRTVYVCRTGQSAGDVLDCKAKSTIP